MKLWPTKKQWQGWSLPSKLTAIGALLAVMSLGIYIIKEVFGITQYLNHSRTSETEQNVAEEGTILIELGYSLYSFGLGADAIPEEFDSDRASRELKELYARLGLSIPKSEFGAEMFKATRSALESERDRYFLDAGMHLAAIYGIGIVMINHRGTNYEIQGKRKMSGLAHELKTALRSLGLLAAIEQERRIESYLMPTSNDTVEAYSQTLGILKAAIVGEIRRQYGT